jgi:hypothetical protein
MIDVVDDEEEEESRSLRVHYPRAGFGIGIGISISIQPHCPLGSRVTRRSKMRDEQCAVSLRSFGLSLRFVASSLAEYLV